MNVETSSGLNGEATPPPAVSLICEAPSMSCSRTRRRTSSGLSATMLPPICSIAAERAADGARQIGKLAEVAVTAGDGDHGAGRDRCAGPATMPSSMARLSAKTGPPMSRTVVKPRISVCRRLRAGQQVGVADVAGESLGGVGPHQHRVPVRVDQARHQRAPAAGDDGDAGGDDR